MDASVQQALTERPRLAQSCVRVHLIYPCGCSRHPHLGASLRDQRVYCWRRHAASEAFVPTGFEVEPIGTVFQAASAIYTGLSRRETFHQLHETGELVHRRALSKVRNGERSGHYVEALLRRAGAPARWPDEATGAWLERVLPLVSSPYVHGGCHRYAFLIGRHRRRVRIAAVAHAYPKQRLVGTDAASTVRRCTLRLAFGERQVTSRPES